MRVSGRAFTMIASAVYDRRPNHYDKLFESYGHMTSGDVVLIATGGAQGRPNSITIRNLKFAGQARRQRLLTEARPLNNNTFENCFIE